MNLLAMLVLSLALIGHLALTFVVINVTHGIGLVWRWLDRATILFFIASGLLSVAAFYWLWGVPLVSWPLPAQIYGLFCLGIALVGMPIDILKRLLRRDPPGIEIHEERLDLSRPPDGGPPPIGQGLGAFLLRLPGNESLHLSRLTFTVQLHQLPRALDGLSVAHVSDFHFTRGFTRRYFEMVADEIAQLDSDLVLFTGDLLDDDTCIPWVEPVFRRMHGKVGSFAILGNHDHLQPHEKIREALSHAGFVDLEGSWASVDYQGSRLVLGGSSAPWGADVDPSDRPEADLSVLLCHTPDHLYEVASWGIDLMFSGHNHGGQIRLPLIGPVLMPSRFSRRFDAGFFRERRTLLYVSRGLAAKHPIRFGCLPEIARFTFRCPELVESGGIKPLRGISET